MERIGRGDFIEHFETERGAVPSLDRGRQGLRHFHARCGTKSGIVALTGWGQDEDKRRSQEAGFNGHLVKPVEPAALENLLTELKSETA